MATFDSKGILILPNLSREGCMRSTQKQCGIWESSQHLSTAKGKPRKPVSTWPVAGVVSIQKNLEYSLTYVLVLY
jgi:hypothetical protein